ncbi:MAG: DNA-binding protein [Spirosoma sp.]|nr:DNA-binding protein [Spirosoma sp.]
MEIVIDSNILFSALLKADGRLAEIILNPAFQLTNHTCYFLYIEIFKYKERILKFSKLEEADLLEVLYRMVKRINFINEDSIDAQVWQQARQLTDSIDTKDTPFVALTLSLNATLWTGDRKLLEGLQAKGFTDVIDTVTLVSRLKAN